MSEIKTVALIYGGQSGEHEVSCISAAYLEQTIAEAGYAIAPIYISRKGVWHLQKHVAKLPESNIENPVALVRTEQGVILQAQGSAQPIDFAFAIIHGTAGEDGSLQGYFEVLGMPYAGAGVAASAVSMDKALMRALFAVENIPQVKYFVINVDAVMTATAVDQRIVAEFGYPVFIKPCNMGSSVGVHRVANVQELAAALADAARFDDHLLCEQGLQVRELEIAIAGNYPNYTTSGVGEIQVNHAFYSYEAKYLDPSGAKLYLDAEISASMKIEIQNLAKQAFAAVRGDGFARIDFFVDRQSEKLYLNEINTLPGFTPISMFPQLFQAAGISGSEITRRIIELGFERAAKIQSLRAATR